VSWKTHNDFISLSRITKIGPRSMQINERERYGRHPRSAASLARPIGGGLMGRGSRKTEHHEQRLGVVRRL
jgi:hypothetical protein